MPILSIGRNTAYKLVRSKQISSITVKRQLQIPKQALIDYLTSFRYVADPGLSHIGW